jgi:hypothetical protein
VRLEIIWMVITEAESLDRQAGAALHQAAD